MKKSFVALLALIALAVVYQLFEPIFNYNFGWKSLPVDEQIVAAHNFTSSDISAIDEAEKILLNAKDELQAPALSVAVGLNNQIIWAEAVGYSNIDTRKKANANTSFRIGSTSKAVTSVALGKLLEEQRLKLDAPVQQYVPYISNIKKPISLRQLASHSSGIRNYSTCFCFPIWEYYRNDEFASVRESIEVFQHDDLLFEPGSRYSYSSYNYTLISGAIEEVVHEPFTSYMEKSIFKPLKMTHTTADYSDSLVTHRATFYEVKDGQYKKAFEVNNSNKWAGGGVISTPSDLVKLGNALLNNTFLNEHTVTTLFTPQQLANGEINEEGYALGWRVNREQKMSGCESLSYVVHHGGVAMGSTSFLVLFPDYKLVVSLLMNRDKPSDFSDFSKYAFLIAEEFIREAEKQGLTASN